jgi:hypothetical protein
MLLLSTREEHTNLAQLDIIVDLSKIDDLLL